MLKKIKSVDAMVKKVLNVPQEVQKGSFTVSNDTIDLTVKHKGETILEVNLEDMTISYHCYNNQTELNAIYTVLDNMEEDIYYQFFAK